MMQFDIIDETSHTEYGQLWLEEMMKRAGFEEDYKARAVQERHDAYTKARRKVEIYQHFWKREKFYRRRTLEKPNQTALEP